MASHRGIRAGVLVLSAWQESESPEGFRARIIGTLDVGRRGEVVEQVVASPQQATTAVHDWLAAFTRSARPAPTRGAEGP